MCMGERPWVPGCHVEADPRGLLLNQTPLTLTNSWLVFAPLLIFRTFISLDASSSQLLLALNTGDGHHSVADTPCSADTRMLCGMHVIACPSITDITQVLLYMRVHSPSPHTHNYFVSSPLGSEVRLCRIRPWRILLRNQVIMLCSYASYYALGLVLLCSINMLLYLEFK